MPQIIEQGDAFGRLGKSFGQGLGETLPKAQERSMLSGELKKLGQEPQMSELDRFARISKIPGGLENFQYIAPLLQQAQQRRDFEQQARPQQAAELGAQFSQPYSGSHLSLSKSFQQRQGTNEALNARASELIATQPALYREPEKAFAKAKQEFDTEEATLANASAEFNKSLETRLQKAGPDVYRDIIGDMKQDYEREAQALAATGKMTPAKAADKLSDDLLEFAKARKNLQTSTAASLFGLGISGKEAQSKLQAIRKQYAERDNLELFADDLVSKTGLTTPMADYIAFPIKSNKEINNFAADSKGKSSLNPFQGALIAGIKEKGPQKGKKRTEKEIGDFIAKHIKLDDSLNSIAATFNGRGYNPQLILDEIQNKWESGKLLLSKRQERDLQKRTNFRASLKDIAYFAATGLNPLEVIP